MKTIKVTSGVKSKNQSVTLAAREILEKKMDEFIDKYPSALKPKDIMEIMNTTQARTYEALNRGDIPGAKKIKGFGWRIPRETFFIWWFSKSIK
jgi:hypothetical protein